MIFVYGFLFCGFVCMLAQLIFENTKWTPGHITTCFVVIGALLESMDIYDFIIQKCGIGAIIPILSFGHNLAHASYASALKEGWLGLISGVFDKSASGISFAIFMAFWVALLFKAHD